MEIKFDRALIGYKKKDVKKEIDLIDKEFEETYTEYYKLLLSLQSENNDLKKQVGTLESQVAEYRNLKEEFVNLLYKIHIDAYTVEYDVLKEIQQKEKDKLDMLEMQKKKYAEIKASVGGFLSQIQNIITDK